MKETIRFDLLGQVEGDKNAYKCDKCGDKSLELLFVKKPSFEYFSLCEPCYKEIGERFNFFRKAIQ